MSYVSVQSYWGSLGIFEKFLSNSKSSENYQIAKEIVAIFSVKSTIELLSE